MGGRGGRFMVAMAQLKWQKKENKIGIVLFGVATIVIT